MPIDRTEFEKGFVEKEPDHFQREILQFLSKNPDQAFTFTEIVQHIGLFRPQVEAIDLLTIVEVGVHTVSVTLALNELEKKGLIVSKETADEPRTRYYIIKQQVGKWAQTR